MSAWHIWVREVLFLLLGVCFGALGTIVIMWPSRKQSAPAEPPAAPPAPVLVKVTRYIPQDLWMEKILEKDVKGANAWLAISMGQMLGPELAPHTTVKALYRPEQADYQVTAWVWVAPKNERRPNYENHD